MGRETQEEFSRWVHDRQHILIKAARSICFDIQNAEDVLQEALADIYPKWNRLKNHENLEAYVIRVMVSKHIDLRRKYDRKKAENEVSLELVATLLETSDGTEDVAERLLVQAAIKSLSAAQRAVLLLVYEYGYSIKDAANHLGIPAGTAASHLARGRSAVGEYVQFVPGLDSPRQVALESSDESIQLKGERDARES
jgi:RNA polymerase sigma factor (sigma-70 family)